MNGIRQPSDNLYNSAIEYEKLKNQEFTFELGTLYKNIKFCPDEKQFFHLAGLAKLQDDKPSRNQYGNNIIEAIKNGNIKYSNLAKSNYFSDQLNGETSVVKYTLDDRLSALSNLYNYLNNISQHDNIPNIEVYEWQKKTNGKEKRPYCSKISADILIEFVDIPNKIKSDNERVCLFLKEDNGEYKGVSIFPSDVTLSNDGIRSAYKYEVLSAEVYNKDTKQKTTLIAPNLGRINIAKDNLLASQEQKSANAEYNKILERFNRLRAKHIKKYPDGKPSTITENTPYENMKGNLQDSQKYSTEILVNITERLKQSEKDTSNEEKRNYIKQEVSEFEETIIERFKNNAIAIENDLKSSSAALSSASSALADDSDSGSNNAQIISLEPPCKQLFDVAQPVFSGQAAGAIALPFPGNPPPWFDISKIITALEALNEKITNAIHSFMDSFSLSHSPKQSAQEQPPQARTAHERKINSELLFPKQKPADERTEPVTAKQEKARKPRVIPSEKQSSWIGNLISSARSESDAHNKNHEPKAHDKDKSL